MELCYWGEAAPRGARWKQSPSGDPGLTQPERCARCVCLEADSRRRATGRALTPVGGPTAGQAREGWRRRGLVSLWQPGFRGSRPSQAPETGKRL